MKTIGLYLACFAALCSACDSDLPSGTRLSKLRLLALRADPPFARPGERVELQLLAADAEERELHYALGTCTDAAGSTVEGCLEALDAPLAVTEPEDGRFAVDIDDEFLRGIPLAARQSAMVGVVLVACPGEIERGTTSGVPVVCRDPAGERLPITEFEVGVKRIFVRERDRNQNPVIERIRWDGRTWPEDEVRDARACADRETDEIDDCAKNVRHRIRVESSQPEEGVDENGTIFREQQIVQFYATTGVFERPVRIAEEPDTLYAAQRSVDEQARLYFVVRDDRGGVAFTERRVRVR